MTRQNLLRITAILVSVGFPIMFRVDGKVMVSCFVVANLSTPLSKTAVKLKEQLAAAGLRENDGKRLAPLVHSLGGLVSRWFIEREGGNRIVDHLARTPYGRLHRRQSSVTMAAITW
jgi:triacylglycerol esterase/lipase EstA (alpha/beta hydrolase family)